MSAVMLQTRGSNVATGDITGTLGSNTDRASGGAPCVLAYSEDGHGGKYTAAAAAAAVRASGGSQGAGSETVIAIQDVTTREKQQNGRGWNMDGTAYTVDSTNTQGVALCAQVTGTLCNNGKAPGSATQQDAETGFLVAAYSGVQSLDVSSALLAHPPRSDLETETFIAHTLRGTGHDASEDGTGRGVPLVPVPFGTTQITSRANRSNPKAGDPCHPLAAGAHVPAIAYAVQEDNQNGVTVREVAGSVRADAPGSQMGGTLAFTMKDHGADAGELSPTLRAGGHGKSHANGGVFPGVANRYGVRRLMPHELERLQGFPDHFTRIPYRGKPAEDCPDGPRAKALGNSMATPVVRWIGARIELVTTLRSPT